MSWFGAMAWAEWLGSINYGGANDWRLPTTLQPDSSCLDQTGSISDSYNCIGSEMGHMFYNNLGGNAGQSVLNQTGDTDEEKANLALFDNVRSYVYWSGTEYAPNPVYAWYFTASYGIQYAFSKGNGSFAWAVRSGDVAAPPSIPEPGSLTLVGLGLVGLGWARRWRGCFG